MTRIIWTALLLTGTVWSLTLNDFSDKPSGHVKNFLIWQYLKQEISPDEAKKAFEQVENVNYKLYMAYAKCSDDPYVLACAECWNLKAFELLSTEDDDCALMGLSPYKVAALKPQERQALFERFGDSVHSPWLRFLAETDAEGSIEHCDPNLFVKILNGTGIKYRQTMLDRDYSPEFVANLASAAGFSRMVKLVVTDMQMEKLQRSLLSLPGDGLDAQTAFFLALNQLRHGDRQAALTLLEYCYDKAYYRMDKDKALFWQFQITKSPQFLNLLSQSVDINIYSLYASELLKSRIDNYFITLGALESEPQADITDPFTWERILDEIRETPKEKLFDMAKQYRTKPLLPVQAFILERAYGYKMHSYILPYGDTMQHMDNERRSILLSLMRQESRFIPSALSRSYALGLMQMMPFLVKAMDKQEQQETGSLHKMFDPETNIDYASRHLDYLQKHLYHPLFIAYAYNGGIGFTKRMLLSGAFSEGDYEPFWSMEMMANSESREYGKKVLANYVLYKRILGEEVSIARLFDTLTRPSLTDRFRASN